MKTHIFFQKLRNILWPRWKWSKTRATIVSFLAVILALAISEFTLGTYTIFSTYISADFNSTTEGEIIKSAMRYRSGGRGGRCEYYIHYMYRVDDLLYQGDLVNLDKHSKPKCDWEVKEIISKYPIGKRVTVYYDSQEPKYSVLENSGLGTGLITRISFFSSIVFLLVWIFSRRVL